MVNEFASRPEEITFEFLTFLDQHLKDVLEGRVDQMKKIKEIAAILCVHPTHLSNTVRLVTGKPACSFYENKIIDVAKVLLTHDTKSITEIAYMLTYDPSNFTKFFKSYVNKTPKQYRSDFIKGSLI